MIFQKKTTFLEEMTNNNANLVTPAQSREDDDVETVVGPSVHVEGDLSSSGNILVKGMVSGNVNTTKHLTVEPGAKIVANVHAGSAKVSGEIKGNVKIKDSLELTSSARILGDISVKVLTVEPGAVLYGKISMPGIEATEKQTPGKRIIKKSTGESMNNNEA